ncbi:Ig-like domain-containing protein [Bacillus salitolerans]|uniref:Ig-like domain-containing protein n=1 Tax=Bacillus salitolerans TaxID=1437434 RepID=A0ABW4LPG6_9BACI
MFKRGLHIALSITLLFVSLFSLMSTNEVIAATNPKLEELNPARNAKHVPVVTDITFRFNEKVKRQPHAEKFKFYKKHTNGAYYSEPIKEIKFSEDVVTVIPENRLEFNREYKIEVGTYAIELENGYYPSAITNIFETNFMEFYELMVLDEAKLQGLLQDYTPREIVISAPKRYIENVEVVHKNKGKVANDASQAVTESLTNIDVKIFENEKVSQVKVEIIQNGKVIRSTVAEKASKASDKQEIYTKGFGNLPVNFDVRITVYDSTFRSIDQKVAKLISADAMFSNVNEKYQYKTANKSFTLYDLLKKPEDFNTLLLENDMKKLMVQVK